MISSLEGGRGARDLGFMDQLTPPGLSRAHTYIVIAKIVGDLGPRGTAAQLTRFKKG